MGVIPEPCKHDIYPESACTLCHPHLRSTWSGEKHSDEKFLLKFDHIDDDTLKQWVTDIASGVPRVWIERNLMNDVASNGKAINRLILLRLGVDISSESAQTIRIRELEAEVASLRARLDRALYTLNYHGIG